MRIYFYDGKMVDAPGSSIIHPCVLRCVYADEGSTMNKQDLMCYQLEEKDHELPTAILTNSLVALSHEYGWNEAEGHTDIYIWRFDLNKYVRIDELTDKDIRKAHNVEKMYRAGVFNPD